MYGANPYASVAYAEPFSSWFTRVIKTVDAKGNIRKTFERSLTSKGNIKVTKSVTITSLANIYTGTGVTKTIEAMARIFKIEPEIVEEGFARLVGTTDGSYKDPGFTKYPFNKLLDE